MRYYTTLQHDERDCGAACLSMIARYHGLNYPISKYRELTKTDRTGTTLYGIANGAKQIGLDAEALFGTPEDLQSGIKNGEISYPFIAHIVSGEGLLHFVVVFAEKNGNYLIGDPARGKRSLEVNSFLEMCTGYIITFKKSVHFHTGNYKKGNFLRFFRLLKGQYYKLISIVILSLLISFIGISAAFIFKVVIDDLLTNAGAANFNIIFISLIVLYFLQAGIQFIRGHLIIAVSKKIDMQLSLSYYNHIVTLPVSSISMRQTGEYLSRFSDIAKIRNAISGASLTLFLDSIMVIGCGIILYTINAKMFAVALLMILLYAVIVLLYKKPVEQSNRGVMESNAQLQSYFKESIDGLETVKAARAESKIKNETAARYNSFINATVKNTFISMTQDTIADTVELIGTALILWAGFAMVLTGQVSIGTLMTFYVLLSYFTEPIKNLIELQPAIQTAIVAADRLNDILELQKETKDDKGSTINTIKSVEFQNVDFRYGDRELTLNDINMTIHRGEKIAIVGESGSGKTTLAKLLLRFYQPERGTILIDGMDINNITLDSLRKNIAYVDQNTFLFSDTIRQNLCLGNSESAEEEIERACRISQADPFIRELPMGYDTPLDENGANLSGGQRQRLAIARALLKNPQLLILDEATSNLDTITETAIKNTIFSLDRELTCMIIAHRLSTVKNCDRIYVMKSGKIVESGTHTELMKKNGTYASLWSMQ